MSRELLKDRWRDWDTVPFPLVDRDEFADLMEYDSFSAGLIDHVHLRREPPYPLEVDHELTKRVEATGSKQHIDYVHRLNELLALAERVRSAES